MDDLIMDIDFYDTINPLYNCVEVGDLRGDGFNELLLSLNDMDRFSVYLKLGNEITLNEKFKQIGESGKYSSYGKKKMSIHNFFHYIMDKYPELKLVYIMNFYKANCCSKIAEIIEIYIKKILFDV